MIGVKLEIPRLCSYEENEKIKIKIRHLWKYGSILSIQKSLVIYIF